MVVSENNVLGHGGNFYYIQDYYPNSVKDIMSCIMLNRIKEMEGRPPNDW